MCFHERRVTTDEMAAGETLNLRASSVRVFPAQLTVLISLTFFVVQLRIGMLLSLASHQGSLLHVL
jgi:hypothetical protein